MRTPPANHPAGRDYAFRIGERGARPENRLHYRCDGIVKVCREIVYDAELVLLMRPGTDFQS